jgi:putative DNA primase/helicase
LNDRSNIIRLAQLQVDGELPPTAEDAIALAFADRHEAELRYVATWGRWLRYDGVRWAYDDTLHAFDLARTICRQVAVAGDKPVSAVASAKTVAAVERLAKADRRLAGTIGQWDADPWLLNTPTGVIDLHTGDLREHSPIDYMTKITAVGPLHCQIPTWLAFLERVTGNDTDLLAFLHGRL